MQPLGLVQRPRRQSFPDRQSPHGVPQPSSSHSFPLQLGMQTHCPETQPSFGPQPPQDEPQELLDPQDDDEAPHELLPPEAAARGKTSCA